MDIKSIARVAATAGSLLLLASGTAAKQAPITADTIEEHNSSSMLEIGDVANFQTPVTVCINKADFDKIIALEKQGGNARALYDSLPGCDSLPLPKMLLMQKLDEYQAQNGKWFYYVQMVSLDGTTILYAAIARELFLPENSR